MGPPKFNPGSVTDASIKIMHYHCYRYIIQRRGSDRPYMCWVEEGYFRYGFSAYLLHYFYPGSLEAHACHEVILKK